MIILKYFNDMTIEDISKIIEIPQNTVKTYLRRAKNKLGNSLEEDYLNE
ncbi:sigma factor-like helix-turn-helix DNA-binding protein [Clostridium gasigenes]